MKTLVAELYKDNNPMNLESKDLVSGTSEEFIEALVLLCNRLDADVPLWTHKEEKMLQKKNEVFVLVDPSRNIKLKIFFK